MDGARILVVDDDPIVRHIVARSLRAAGFEVLEAVDGATALEALAEGPDLVVLDVVLPDANGLDVLARIRTTARVPVIMLSGQTGEDDRVVGLELGADDYVCKPFAPRELQARVRNLLRRSPDASPPKLCFDGLEIDVAGREVRVGGDPIELTPKEFDVLAYLAARPRQVHSRDALLRQVWDSRADWQDPDTVTEHVRRLRRKLEPDSATPRWIRTVRGAGYVFAG